MTKALLVASTGSGRGKTSLTLGLLRALARRGLSVAPFKTGPDFIDPGLHALACGQASVNLDSWMLSDRTNRALFARRALGADVALIEGAMGLFDGLDGADERGSAAHMAKLVGAGVLLAADVSGMARSVAALVQGFARFDPHLRVIGVACNKVGGPGHREILTQALAGSGMPPLLGLLPRDPGLALPSRHLGLVTAEDLTETERLMDRLADWAESGLNLDALLAAAPVLSTKLLADWGREPDAPPTGAPVRLGVARDRAFSFCYAENLPLLSRAGAEVVFFSPLEDAGLPPDLDGLYLPGGYPELHAARLAANAGMLGGLRAFCASGRPVYAECGGFMLLMEGLEDPDGAYHPMAGVFPFRARMGRCFAALGYREARLAASTPLGPAGTVARGHEFHYSFFEEAPGPGVYARTGRAGPLEAPDGFLVGQTLGAYTHLHFASNPDLADNFVAAMRRAKTLAGGAS